MSKITRCDHCKKLSDEQNVGFIGKKWSIKKYRESLGVIETTRDLCWRCLKEMINENSLSEYENIFDS